MLMCQVAVFDGHGAFGEVAAGAALGALVSVVKAQTMWLGQPETCMLSVMQHLHTAVLVCLPLFWRSHTA